MIGRHHVGTLIAILVINDTQVKLISKLVYRGGGADSPESARTACIHGRIKFDSGCSRRPRFLLLLILAKLFFLKRHGRHRQNK